MKPTTRKTMRTTKAIIIGGGITGLSAAYHLQEEAKKHAASIDITLLEAADRLGGKIITEHTDGFTIEGGPDCFLRQKPWAAQLCRNVGLESALMGTNDESRRVFVVNRQRLTPLPKGVLLIVPTKFMPFVTSPLISLPGKLRMGMDVFIPPNRSGEDESVGDFVRRRLGQEALDKIAEPLMSGIHVSDPEYQSLLGTFPRFRALEEEHGSLIRGMLAQRWKRNPSRVPQKSSPNGIQSIFVSLKDGLGNLVETVEKSLDGVQVITGRCATAVQAAPEGQYLVAVDNDTTYTADAVVLALPASAARQLLHAFNPRLADNLAEMRYITTATVSLGFHKADIEHPLNGFGYVSPRKEKRQVSACTWTSTKFSHRAPGDSVLVRCFVGGPGREHLVDLNDDELIKLARQELAEMMNIHAAPVLTRIYRWHKANPQYRVGHLQWLQEIKTLSAETPGLYLAGSSFDGVGIPDCTRQGEEAARAVYQHLDEIQRVSPLSESQS